MAEIGLEPENPQLLERLAVFEQVPRRRRHGCIIYNERGDFLVARGEPLIQLQQQQTQSAPIFVSGNEYDEPVFHAQRRTPQSISFAPGQGKRIP